jgi:hypothetical protein
MLASLLCFGPAIWAALAALLLRSGLRGAKLVWWQITLSLMMLAGLVYWLEISSSEGVSGGVYSFIVAVFVTAIVAAAVIEMLWSLKSWRRLAPVILPLLLLPALFIAIEHGRARSPESVTEQCATMIAEALGKYHADNGTYPAALSQLTPAYLASIPEPLTTQGTGWLYEGTPDHYTLGYWRWPEKLGAHVCLFSSSTYGMEVRPKQLGAV